MAPELAALFPEIRTYAGQGIDDPAATIRLDITPQGFHAQVLSPRGDYYVDPYYHLETKIYACYFKSDVDAAQRMALMGTDLHENVEFPIQMISQVGPLRWEETPPAAERELLTPEESQAALRASARGTSIGLFSPQGSSAKGGGATETFSSNGSDIPQARPSGAQLRTYRTAVAATAEYTAFHGGTYLLGQAAVATAINRVTGVFEKELAIRLSLIANNNLLIYTNPDTDPYTNNDLSALIAQNQVTIDGRIGNANYDVGHVFGTSGGGLATTGVGFPGYKAQGATGVTTPIGDSFYIDYVAHEVAHQFNARHTWSGSTGSCRSSAYAPGTAVEPGSGSTIMSYAGICGADDIAAHAEAVFHAISAEQIIKYVDEIIPSVGTRTSTGNAIPIVDAGEDYAVPLGTPFTLTATGFDSDTEDVLTYSWEPINGKGPQKSLATADNGVSAAFQSRVPTTSPERTFPQLTDLLANTPAPGEKLPTVARTVDFRVTVRDNRSGGGAINTDDMRLKFVNTGAPFQVTSPNDANVRWTTHSTQLVTWYVAGTAGNGINTSHVNIRLSTDGGLTFPILLASAVPNSGAHLVDVPATAATTSARIRVEPVGNIYFDISDFDFTIDPAVTPFDSGDAPASYGDARHAWGSLRLGKYVDADIDVTNMLPGTTDGPEEDGIVFLSPLVAGEQATIRVGSSPAGAMLDYFIDFDANGVFGNTPDEVFSATLTAGVQTLTIPVPASAAPGISYARFRLSTSGGLGPTGDAHDGEVEDYAVTIYTSPPTLDFGDAPSSYGTTIASAGPSHAVNALRLGSGIDGEADGTPSAMSTGDGADDDGVRFTELLIPGTTANVIVTIAGLDDHASLDCFFDFDRSGVFGDQPNEIFRFPNIETSMVTLPIAVPPDAVIGVTHARFRLSTQGQLSPYGFSADGEVEDYQVRVISPTVITSFETFDGVTAPALPPGWTRSSTVSGGPAVNWSTVNDTSDTVPNHAFVPGADYVSTNHLMSPPFVVTEANQQIRFRHAYDHEYTFDGGVLEISTDGTTFVDFVSAGGTFVSGGYTTVVSSASTLNTRNTWSAGSGDYYETIANLPSSLLGQTVYLRWTEGTDSSIAGAGWRIDTIQSARTWLAFDYGDAPFPYPTAAEQLGAVHSHETSLRLGVQFDTELVASPNANATGDDFEGSNDEDGVTFVGAIEQGGTGLVHIVASEAGLLSAWLDFNDDGDWADEGEQIFRDEPIDAGLNQLTFPVGVGAVVTPQTFARFRLSSQAGLWYSGQAPDGEVEDYEVAIVASPNFLVTAMTPTSTGFILDLNHDLDLTALHLFDDGTGQGPPDVTLIGEEVGPIRGSLVIGANSRQATFVATSGRLPPDLYTIAVRSAADAFVDINGVLLDGDADGTPGGDYVTMFTVSSPPSNAVTVSLPNFARGPQQPVDVPATSSGLPVSFSDGGGINTASFRLRFDPALLTITAATVAAGLPVGATVSLDTSVPGIASIHFQSPTPLPAGTTRFVELHASIPADAPYRAKQVLDLDYIILNGGEIPALDDDAVHVVAYFGDVTANGTYSAFDASIIAQLAIGAITGLTEFPLLDPTIIADITGAAGLSATDMALLMQQGVGITVPEIPPLPFPAVSLVSGGPDPKLSIPREQIASRSAPVTIPVMIDSIVDLTGNGLRSADLVIYFDPEVLDVQRVSLGDLVSKHAGNWFISSRIDPTTGRIDVAVGGLTPLEGVFTGELVQLHAVVKESALAGATAINLAASSSESFRATLLNEGYLTLIPAPTNSPNDSIDGLLTIVDQQPAMLPIGLVTPNTMEVPVSNHSRFSDPLHARQLGGPNPTVQDQAILQLLAPAETGNEDNLLDAWNVRKRR